MKTYGYGTVQTQLHSVPPVAAGLGLCLITAYLSDRYRVRFPFIAFALTLAIVGLAILMNVHHSFSAEYAGICLVAMGMFSAGVVIICWYVMNLKGHAERAIGTAWMIGFGNCSGIIAAFSFLTTDAPYYHTGYSICMGAMCICLAASTLYAGLIWLENQKIKKGNSDGKHTDYYYL